MSEARGSHYLRIYSLCLTASHFLLPRSGCVILRKFGVRDGLRGGTSKRSLAGGHRVLGTRMVRVNIQRSAGINILYQQLQSSVKFYSSEQQHHQQDVQASTLLSDDPEDSHRVLPSLVPHQRHAGLHTRQRGRPPPQQLRHLRG